MGQFDLETDAALAQLNFEEISKTPGGEFAEIASDLLKLVGGRGPWSITGGAVSLLQKIRALAGAGYASNLIYVVTAVRDDLADLYSKHVELRGRIEALPDEPKFAEAIAALALRAMHTSVKARLKRLARIVVNGVKENDLEPENLDDMMRAAVELTERDILELRVFISRQSEILGQAEKLPMQWYDNVRRHWQSWAIEDGTEFRNGKLSYFDLNSSRSKLAAFGFIIAIPPAGTTNSPDVFPYALLPEGKKFYECLQEIATNAE
ncbi:MAG: hypothetical protein ABSD59_01620 [Terracidiphilus sp.]